MINQEQKPIREELAKLAEREQAKERARKRTIIYRFKTYAWRATAIYLWVRFLTLFLGGIDLLGRLEAGLTRWFIDFLTSIGFAPANAEYVPAILKTSWILIIVGFKPVEIVGLVFYSIFFPLVAIFYLLVRAIRKRKQQAHSARKETPLHVRREPVQFVAPLMLAFLVWFLLYGEGVTARQIIPGTTLSGLLLLALSYRVFARVRPALSTEGVPGWSIIANAYNSAKSIEEKLREKAEKKDSLTEVDAAFDLKIHRPMWKVLRRSALFVRGPRGQSRAAMYILAEYILSLLFLGFLAGLFWGLVIRAATATDQLSLATCVYWSISFFLPGVPSPKAGIELQGWIPMGAGLTGVVLFILFVAAAASQLPGRQRLFAERITTSYRYLRHLTIFFGRYVRKLERVKQKSSETQE